MSSIFRPYQTSLVQAVMQALQTHRNVLAVCATGSGKTVMAAGILKAEPGASVFIAHRTELVAQASLALAREGVRHNIIGPSALQRTCAAIHTEELGWSYFDPSAKCAVAGVDTLVRMPADTPWFAQVRLWICDEAAHLLRENKWGKSVALFPNARGIGFTATPVRSDGKGLGAHADGVFHHMECGPTMRWLIQNQFLTPYRLFCPPSDIDVSNVPISASGDFSPTHLRDAVHKSRVVGDIVAHYKRVSEGRRDMLAMTFCVDVEAAEETATALRSAGVSAEVVTGKTPDLLRSRIMRQFRQREILQLVSVDIMGEGVDVPAVEVVQKARPTQSLGLYMQQVGRGLRLMDGKKHAIILDHAGNSRRHGLVDAHREWTLDARERRARSAALDVVPVRSCLKCMGVYERILLACPYCGEAPAVAARSAPEQVDGDLVELDAEALERMREAIEDVDGAPTLPRANEIIQRAVRNRHWEKQQAQKSLRHMLQYWGGLHTGRGDDLREAWKRFYFRFGVDVATAQTLSAREAGELEARVVEDLKREGVDCG